MIRGGLDRHSIPATFMTGLQLYRAIGVPMLMNGALFLALVKPLSPWLALVVVSITLAPLAWRPIALVIHQR